MSVKMLGKTKVCNNFANVIEPLLLSMKCFHKNWKFILKFLEKRKKS